MSPRLSRVIRRRSGSAQTGHGRALALVLGIPLGVFALVGAVAAITGPVPYGRFDVQSVNEWAERIMHGPIDRRIVTMRYLMEHEARDRVSCAMLAQALADTVPVRDQAIATTSVILRRGRCAAEVVAIAQSNAPPTTREAALQALGAAGRVVGSAAVPTLLQLLDPLRPLDTDRRTRAVVLQTLVAIGDRSSSVIDAVERTAARADLAPGADVVDALVQLRAPSCTFVRVAREVLREGTAEDRVTVLHALEDTAYRSERECPVTELLRSVVDDADAGVQRAARDALARVTSTQRTTAVRP